MLRRKLWILTLLLAASVEMMAQYDPSFAKTFSIGSNSVESVREYRAESNRSDILAVDWSEDVQVVSAACARRITLS